MVKIFSHRGYVDKNSKENSFASLKLAYENGFHGIEFDVWLTDDLLVLKHDKPNKNEINDLAKFSDYFYYGNKIEYWIDFKNLREDNIDKVLDILLLDKNFNNIDNNKIYFAPFITNLSEAVKIYKAFLSKYKNAQIVAVCEELLKKDFIKYREELRRNDINFLSIAHEIIDEEFMAIFSGIEIFAWTIKDKKRFLELKKLGVRNFASDIILSDLY